MITADVGEVIKTVSWAIVLVTAINGITVYSIIKATVLGKPLIDRKPQADEPARIHRIGG